VLLSTDDRDGGRGRGRLRRGLPHRAPDRLEPRGPQARQPTGSWSAAPPAYLARAGDAARAADSAPARLPPLRARAAGGRVAVPPGRRTMEVSTRGRCPAPTGSASGRRCSPAPAWRRFPPCWWRGRGGRPAASWCSRARDAPGSVSHALTAHRTQAPPRVRDAPRLPGVPLPDARAAAHSRSSRARDVPSPPGRGRAMKRMQAGERGRLNHSTDLSRTRPLLVRVRAPFQCSSRSTSRAAVPRSVFPRAGAPRGRRPLGEPAGRGSRSVPRRSRSRWCSSFRSGRWRSASRRRWAAASGAPSPDAPPDPSAEGDPAAVVETPPLPEPPEPPRVAEAEEAGDDDAATRANPAPARAVAASGPGADPGTGPVTAA
jgi:hypothetical protein